VSEHALTSHLTHKRSFLSQQSIALILITKHASTKANTHTHTHTVAVCQPDGWHQRSYTTTVHYTQDASDTERCWTWSVTGQSLMMRAGQSAGSYSSSALVSCPSASPAGCGHFTVTAASRCRRPLLRLRSLDVRSHSLMTACTSTLLADFVRRLSHTASA